MALFGEMPTLMNYTHQSFNLRGRDSIRPYYALISNIAAEEGGHIEIVTAAIYQKAENLSERTRLRYAKSCR